MVLKIIEGISVTLFNVFGDQCQIYVMDTNQGLQEPCFLIQLLEVQRTPLLGNKSLRIAPFDILYFPDRPDDNREMIRVAETLVHALRVIVLLDGTMKLGTGIRYEIQDNVLHFFVNYNFMELEQPDLILMQTLETDVKPKHER